MSGEAERAVEEREEWRAVPDWPAYEVSSLGRVRRGRRLLRTGGSKYPQVTLGNRRTRRENARVHILVLTAFVGPCPPGMECRHLDDVKTNCRLSNLQWGTRSENHGEDRRRNGRLTIGTKHGMSKLNDQAVLAIRYFLKEASHGRPLLVARLYGVDPATIRDIQRGRYWTHVGGPIDTRDHRLLR